MSCEEQMGQRGPAVYSKGSRKEYDRTETDSLWEVTVYDGVDDVGPIVDEREASELDGVRSSRV